MAFFRGEQGTVFFDKNAGGAALSEIAAVRSWSLTVDKEAVDVTGHGDTYRVNRGSLISGSGTMEIFYDAPGAGDKLDLLNEICIQKDPANANIELYLDETGGKKIHSEILVTSAEYSATVGDIEVVTINFVTNGTITLSI